MVLIRGKVNARDKEGNTATEAKIMVDDAREITTQQASGYQATGKKAKTPKAKDKDKTKIKAQPKLGRESPPKTSVPVRIYIRLANTGDEKTLFSLKETLDAHRGETEVVLVLGEASTKQAIKLPGGLDRSSDGLSQLQQLVGADNLVIQ